MSDIKIFSPKRQTSGPYQDMAYGYVPGNSIQWTEKTYFGNDPVLSSYSEIFFDDVLSADNNPRNLIYQQNGTRIAFSYIPFYIKNVGSYEVFDLGIRIVNNPTDIIGEPNGANLSNNERQDADQTDSPRNFSSLQVDTKTGFFPLGVCDSFTTNQSSIENMTSSLWTTLYGKLTNTGSRIILNSTEFIEARNWFSAAPAKQPNFSQGNLSYSYKVHKWNSAGRTSFTNINTTNSITTTIKIPAGGCLWGYFYINVSNENSTASRILANGADISFTDHGNWTTTLLENSHNDDGVYMNVIKRPWDVTSIDLLKTRLFRFGIQVAGKRIAI